MYTSDRKRPCTHGNEVSEQRRLAYRSKRPCVGPVTAVGSGGFNMDRFIPQVTSGSAYKASPSLKRFDIREPELLGKSPSPERLSSPGFFHDLRQTGHYEAITRGSRSSEASRAVEGTSSGFSSMMMTEPETPKLSFEQKRHREYIADSLGFQSPQRVLHFTTPQPACDKKMCLSSDQHTHYLAVDPLTTALHPSKAMAYLAASAFSRMNRSLSYVANDETRRPAKRMKSHIPYRVLDAPCLRNDFYSNLVSWSKSTDNVMVGLGCSVYMWSDKQGAIPVLNHDYLSRKHDVVTCVSFCPYNLLFVIGTKQGRVLLFDQDVCLERKRTEDAFVAPLYEYQSATSRGISCVQWLQRGATTSLLIGEECGDVSYLTVKESFQLLQFNLPTQTVSENRSNPEASPRSQFQYVDDYQGYKLECLSKFQAQAQQVCGISLNEDQSLLAVGGNDNSCTLWDVSSFYDPKLRCILPHNAAVKAVAFCPWSKSLLATGGGSKDRTIKFWHTSTGTLLDQIEACGQVTSLIWSTRYKQIVATFGFGDLEDPILITLYSYPRLTPLKQVRSPTPLRVLSAVASPNVTSICVATNDETIRFYDLWNDKEEVINEIQEAGIFGSDIMEYVEGIEGGHNKIIR